MPPASAPHQSCKAVLPSARTAAKSCHGLEIGLHWLRDCRLACPPLLLRVLWTLALCWMVMFGVCAVLDDISERMLQASRQLAWGGSLHMLTTWLGVKTWPLELLGRLGDYFRAHLGLDANDTPSPAKPWAPPAAWWQAAASLTEHAARYL